MMNFIFTTSSGINSPKSGIKPDHTHTTYQEYKKMCMALEEAEYQARERIRVEKEGV